MKYAICQELFEGWDWERQCRYIAETGYTGIEIAPFTLANTITDLDDGTLETLGKTARDHGLDVIGLHWLLAKTEGMHLTADDASLRQRAGEYLIALGEACAKLGGTLMVFGSPGQRSLQPGVSREQAMNRAVQVFEQCLPRLEAVGVEICMEPLTEKETDFINTCAEAKELIDRVGRSNFTLHQDVKAMAGAETDPLPQVIHDFKEITRHFHANDVNLQGPGMGEIDFVPIMKALLETEYSGYVSVEVFDYSPGAERIAEESLHNMRTAEQTAREQLGMS